MSKDCRNSKAEFRQFYNPNKPNRSSSLNDMSKPFEMNRNRNEDTKVAAIDLVSIKCFKCGRNGHMKAKCPELISLNSKRPT